MRNFTKRLISILLMLVFIFASVPTTVFADEDFMEQGKTYKLKVSNDINTDSKPIYVNIAAGKSVTYDIQIPKGALYVQLDSFSDIKVEVYNSKNKVVKKIKTYLNQGEEKYYSAKSAVTLSKGKYKIKITPVKKNSGAEVQGFVNVIKDDKSRAIKFNQDYFTYVTKGKTYKLTFEVKKDGLMYSMNNVIIKLESNDRMGYSPEATLVDSKGKTVRKITEENMYDVIELKKGKYTITFKASMTGCLYTNVYELEQ